MPNKATTPAPALPLPEPLRGLEEGTWAHSTVSERLPAIGRRILAENDFSTPIVARLEDLIADLPHGRIRPLHDPQAPDWAAWRHYCRPYLGQTWLEIPWFFAETYFYRRVLAASGYYQPGEGRGVDPFAHQKRLGLETSRNRLAGAVAWVDRRLEEAVDDLTALWIADLWGNSADLSLWPVEGPSPPEHQNPQQAREQLLVEDLEMVHSYWNTLGTGARVDLVTDNAGYELAIDLLLVDALLSSGLARQVYLRLKAHPTFVSDATVVDFEHTLVVLAADENPRLGSLARRLRQFGDEGLLVLHADFYWTSPLAGWEMPDVLYGDLARSDLVIFKGDANYRRLLGDHHWPYTTPFADILAYFPAPLLALRTFKSQVACGLRSEQVARLEQLDPTWMVNGRWGVIQFYCP